MLTTDQIRTLNDARTILKNLKTPDSREGGHAQAMYVVAEDAVFQALNVTRSYLGEAISDDLMHNRENPDRTRPLGRADSLEIVGDEDGFELHFGTDSGAYVVNVHGIAHELLAQVNREIGGWMAEGAAAARDQRDLNRPFQCDPDESCGYEPSDPKHPGWSTRVADAYDTQRGDR